MKDEIQKFNDLYDISIEGDNVVVKCKNYTRTRVHPKNEEFCINSKVKRITFTKDAIDFFEKHQSKYTLIEVQNVVNILSISLQNITEENIKRILNRERRK